MRRHHVVPRLDPPAPVALVAQTALGAMADQIDLAIPLAVTGANRTNRIEIPRARLDGDAVERVGVLRGGAGDDAGFVGHELLSACLTKRTRRIVGGVDARNTAKRRAVSKLLQGTKMRLIHRCRDTRMR